MATISSISTFEAPAPLAGCGIDAELVERFSPGAHQRFEASPLIFSRKELAHCHALADDEPAGLCVAFCCKEAVFKALGVPFNGPECEICWHPENGQAPVLLSERLLREFNLSGGQAFVTMKDSGECLVYVYLYGAPEVTL